MALRVPKDQIVSIRAFLEMPQQKVDSLLHALKESGPQFNIYDLAQKASKRAQIPEPATFGILRVVASLYWTWDQQHQPRSVQEFVDGEVFAALKLAGAFSEEKAELEWKVLRDFIVGTLSLEGTVGTTVKAGPVLTCHERIFSSARILTDLRPIYHFEVKEKPNAAVVIHMLCITQRDSQENKTDFFFALDSNDLASLRELIDRAMAKERTLRAVAKDSGLIVLDPKPVY